MKKDSYSLDAVIASLPQNQQNDVEREYQRLKAEIAGLQELRLLAAKTRKDIAEQLGIRQPTLSRMEKQSDMLLSTLSNYVRACGGALELVVTLPGHPPLHLTSLAEIGFGEGGEDRPA